MKHREVKPESCYLLPFLSCGVSLFDFACIQYISLRLSLRSVDDRKYSPNPNQLWTKRSNSAEKYNSVPLLPFPTKKYLITIGFWRSKYEIRWIRQGSVLIFGAFLQWKPVWKNTKYEKFPRCDLLCEAVPPAAAPRLPPAVVARLTFIANSKPRENLGPPNTNCTFYL